jgi:ligand-binding sensor domain-containing protein
MRRSRWILIAAVPTVIALGAAAFVFTRVQHSLDSAGVTVAREGRFAFQMRSLGRMENPGFEAIASPVTYTSGAYYRGKLYVSGPSGLFIYGPDDSLLKNYKVGMDLPAAALGQMVVAKLRGASKPELLIATSGAGILIFSDSGRGDGSGSFRQLYADDAEARDVTSLLPLSSGDLLIGTRRRGLLNYSGKALESFDPQLANLAVTALASDATGFWAGTRDHGVRHWHAGQVDSFEMSSSTNQPGLPDEQVDSIAVSGDRVFVGTPLGVEEFDGGRPARVLAKNVFAHALFADDRRLTIGSLDEGIRLVSLEGARRLGAASHDWDQPGDSKAGAAEGFFEATDDTSAVSGNKSLYAVMRDGVERRRQDGGWEPVDTQLSSDRGTINLTATLTDGNVSALAFGPDGRLWVGYFDRGLDVLAVDKDRSEQATQHQEDDHLFCINRIVVDPIRKTMAVATANGLVLFDTQGKPRQVMTRRDGLIADHVTDIAFIQGGMVVGTPAGLTFVDAGGAQSLYAFQGLVNNHVYALGVRAEDGQILAGTLGGISLLKNESVARNLTVSNSGLKHNWITAIVPVASNDGEWMIGTYGAGVMALDKNGHFSPMDGVTRAMVVNPNAMLVTDSHVFAGTLGQGLWVCDRATGHWRQVMAGLPSTNVTALAEHDGEVYVGTENGLVRIAEKLLE